MDKPVVLSINFFRLQSTIKSKCDRKSNPIIGQLTSATMKSHVRSRRKPKSMGILSSPYTPIFVPFAAYNGMIVSSCLFSFFGCGGITDLSAPVSIKNSWDVDLSKTTNLLGEVFESHLLISCCFFTRSSPTPGSDDEWLLSFLIRCPLRNCMVLCTGMLGPRIFDDNGKYDSQLAWMSLNGHGFFDCLVILNVIGLFACHEPIL